ncbi:MAG: hypothetical protein M1828_003910 [Chrysothrix sp. TS-e1954]|nr:MAG: hypothetical protein M1828_003910 [Chrysothrix sp. TS-e1954]
MSFLKIDVHAHMIPDFYRDAHEAWKASQETENTAELPEWSPEDHIKFMKNASIKRSYLSIIPPGPTFGASSIQHKDVELTRHINNFGSDLKRNHPSKFGYFACLPLPDLRASVLEVQRCARELGNVDGFVIFANASQGGNITRTMQPVLDALNALGSILFLHPLPDCTVIHPFPSRQDNTSEAAFVQVAVETSSRLLLSNFPARYLRLRYILPHAGDVLPQVITNVLHSTLNRSSDDENVVPENSALHDDLENIELHETEQQASLPLSPERLKEILATSVYLDLAGNCSPEALHELLLWVDHTRLLYGSNVPLMPFAWASPLEEAFSETLISTFGAETGAHECLRICNGNAEALLAT